MDGTAVKRQTNKTALAEKLYKNEKHTSKEIYYTIEEVREHIKKWVNDYYDSHGLS